MTYLVTGLPIEQFEPLFAQSDADLAEAGVHRVAVTGPGSPCRVTLQDAAAGETVLLLNYEHQPASTPFRSRHAIYVRETARATAQVIGRLPEQLASRMLSLRAFDADGMLIDAGVVDGASADPLIERLLGVPRTAYLHAHFAAYGCYAARIDRA